MLIILPSNLSRVFRKGFPWEKVIVRLESNLGLSSKFRHLLVYNTMFGRVGTRLNPTASRITKTTDSIASNTKGGGRDVNTSSWGVCLANTSSVPYADHHAMETIHRITALLTYNAYDWYLTVWRDAWTNNF